MIVEVKKSKNIQEKNQIRNFWLKILFVIWKWLKAGYMEEGKYYDTISGTPQGGVISPILANIYLNEL